MSSAPWLVLILLLSVEPSPQTSGEFAPDPSVTQTQPSTPASAAMTDAEAEAIAREIIPRVEEIRGLKFLRPVPVKVVNDATARSHFEARVGKFWPEEKMKLEQTAYRQLGLMPEGSDFMEGLYSLLEEQAGGYYDPDLDTFYVLDDMPKSIAPMLMAHELTHALDDQHFSLDTLFMETKDDFDRSGVISAVVEGSGTLVMSVFLVKELQAGRMKQSALQELAQSEAGRGERLKAAPSFMQRGLIAPYLVGMGFVLRGDLARVTAGVRVSDLDRVLRAPPASSEQVLHPEKYWDDTRRDLPRPVILPNLAATLGNGWSLLADGNLGELSIAILAGAPDVDFRKPEAAMTTQWTNAAASGWGGDRWQLYGNGERRVTLLATLWDTPADAVEFEGSRNGTAGPSTTRMGDAVVLVGGDAPERSADLAAAALKAVTGKQKKRS